MLLKKDGYKTLTITSTKTSEFIKHQIYVVDSLEDHTFEKQLVHQLSNKTKSTKMIPLLQYLKRLSEGKSKYVMMCLVKPEMKAQYCEGTRKGLNFADEVSSAGSGKMPYYEREIGQLKWGSSGETIEETLQEEKSSNLKGGIYHKTQIIGRNEKVEGIALISKSFGVSISDKDIISHVPDESLDVDVTIIIGKDIETYSKVFNYISK